jgi:hypothetical protein
MTEDEALKIARRYLSDDDAGRDRVVSIVHVTGDRLRNMHDLAASQRTMSGWEIDQYKELQATIRNHWAVCFAFDLPPGVITSPPGTIVLVYDDTGEAEIFPAL